MCYVDHVSIGDVSSRSLQTKMPFSWHRAMKRINCMKCALEKKRRTEPERLAADGGKQNNFQRAG